MDQARFDTMARTLAASDSRRRALRLLGGSALASVGLVRVAAGTEAKRNQACCAQKRKACNQLCHDQGTRLDNAEFTCNPERCTPGSVFLCNCV